MTANSLHRARGIIRVVTQATSGERNRALFWAAMRARHMLLAGEINKTDGAELLRILHREAISGGLPAREAERTIKSAMRPA